MDFCALAGAARHVDRDAECRQATVRKRARTGASARRIRSLMLTVICAGLLVEVGLPQQGRAASYAPPAIPGIPADPTTGYPGYQGYNAPPFETNDYSTSDSCQVALNAEINALTQQITSVPSSVTKSEFDAATATITALQTEALALGDLRPACLMLPASASNVAVGGGSAPLLAMQGNKYLFLRVFCPGYSACIVNGTIILDAIGSFLKIIGHGTNLRSTAHDAAAPLVIGHASFSLAAGQSPRVRITISRSGRKILGRLSQIRVRIHTTATYPGDGVRVTHQSIRTLKSAH